MITVTWTCKRCGAVNAFEIGRPGGRPPGQFLAEPVPCIGCGDAARLTTFRASAVVNVPIDGGRTDD